MCPNCKKRLLLALELGGVEIDHCPVCGGVWLDSGELELIAARGGVDNTGLAPAPVPASADAKGASPPRKLKCPRCGRQLAPSRIGQGPTAVHIDLCPANHGLWLDRGELRQIILNPGEDASPATSAAVSAVAQTLAEMLRFELNPQTQGDPK